MTTTTRVPHARVHAHAIRASDIAIARLNQRDLRGREPRSAKPRDDPWVVDELTDRREVRALRDRTCERRLSREVHEVRDRAVPPVHVDEGRAPFPREVAVLGEHTPRGVGLELVQEEATHLALGRVEPPRSLGAEKLQDGPKVGFYRGDLGLGAHRVERHRRSLAAHDECSIRS
jgi:hypothetical protein